MEKKYSLLVFFLILVSLPLANAALESDFKEITIDGKTRFTHKNLVDSDFIIASDKVFYGSKEGQVSIELFLQNKVKSGDYRIGLETRSKSFSIDSISINGSVRNLSLSPSKTFEDSVLFSLDSKTTKIILNISFDPNIIGIREEFDIIIYNSLGIEVARYDPFVSGFSIRQKLTLDTTQLSGDVTNAQSIIVYIDPTNTDFWDNEGCGNGNGLTFSQSDEITELNYEDINFNLGDQNAWFTVNMTETFTSATDLEQFFYYGGTCVDNSDGTAAYPSDYTAVWHMEELSGSVSVDSTVNDFNLTHNSSPTLNVLGQINLGTSYTTTPTSTHATLLDSGYSKLSICFWHKRSSLDALGDIIIKDNIANSQGRYQFNAGGTGALTFNVEDDLGASHLTTATKTDWDTTQFFHICGTFDSADDNFMALYVNASTVDGDTLSEGMNSIGAGTFTDLTVGANALETLFLDEVKVFDGVELSADEVELMFLSESNQLITFGAQEVGFIADFNFSLNPNGLDPENGLNSVTVTLLDDSSPGSPPIISDWNYFIDGIQFFHSTVNGNTTREITTAGDFNITLIIVGDGNVSQKDKNVSISTLVQNVDINFFRNTFTASNADVNFGVTFTGNADVFNWGFPGDQNQLTRNINKTFNSAGLKTVCVTITNLSDANKTVCENFIVGRIIVKIPLDITSLLELTPFNTAASANPPQSLSNLSADTNFFFFSGAGFSSIIGVDLNTDFFPTSRIFDFTSVSNDFVFQPYLVPTSVTEGLEITIFTIDNQNNRTSLPGIQIESFTDVNGVSTLVESKFSDGTGVALFHFDLDKTYTLNFFQNGILRLTLTIVPSSANLFVFIETGTFIEPSAVSSVQIEWYSNVTFIPLANGLISLSQLLTPIATTIGDVNIIVTHNNVLIFNAVQNFDSDAADLNVAFDVNVSGLDEFKIISVRLQIFDVNGLLVVDKIGTYSFTTNVVFRDSISGLRAGLGVFASALISVLLIIFVMAGIIKFRPAQDNNWLFGIGATFIGIGIFYGFISFVPGVLGIFFGGLLTVWKVRD